MSDGAHLGVSADRAIKTILGNDPSPSEDEGRSIDEMRTWLLSAPTVAEFEAYLNGLSDGEYTDNDYGQCARVAGRVILEAFISDSFLATVATEPEYEWSDDPDHGSQGMKPEFTISRGLSAELRDRDIKLPEGMSGFQWGWAVNAARYCVELPSVPNPAILEIDIEPD